jgi:hypothetical protein
MNDSTAKRGYLFSVFASPKIQIGIIIHFWFPRQGFYGMFLSKH